MAYTKNIAPGTVTKIQEDRYNVSVNLVVEDTDPVATLFDGNISVRWDGDPGTINEVALALKNKIQAQVNKVTGDRTKVKSSAYNDMVTWLNENVTV
jgi:hypothetical protein